MQLKYNAVHLYDFDCINFIVKKINGFDCKNEESLYLYLFVKH